MKRERDSQYDTELIPIVKTSFAPALKFLNLQLFVQ
jgi:hypothetical protein